MELCSTSRGAFLNGRSTWNFGVSSKHTGPTGGNALQTQTSLHDWVLPQWILIKLYLEKLCFNICDGNSSLKSGFPITVVALQNHPIAYPGGMVLSASEMWVCSVMAFQSIRVFNISVTLMLLCVATCVCLSSWFNGCWWGTGERNGQTFWSEFLTCKWKLEEKFFKRG